VPSLISNFKERLRLPRMFFRRPTREEQVHGGPPLEFERPIPPAPWRSIAITITMIVIAATLLWEFYARSRGYAPTLSDNADLWTLTRRKVQPESVVIIGDSRAWFDFDLDELERGLGKRPIQLAAPGSTAWPMIDDLAKDETFRGTVICSFIPILFFAPPGSPPMDRAEKNIKRWHTQTPAQRVSEYLAMWLEEHVAFLKPDDLSLDALLTKLPIPNRPGAQVLPEYPPYFQAEDRERRARMWEKCAEPGSKLAQQLQQIWIPLFTIPPPPSWVEPSQFRDEVKKRIQQRFVDVASAVEKIQARGGKFVFVRLPKSGLLKEMEDKSALGSPRSWHTLLRVCHAPGIFYSDFPELSGFTCPEWSHLSAPDSVEFSRRLVPHLREALGMAATP